MPLGDGDVAVADIVAALEAAGYPGWYVLEQDTALPSGGDPYAARPVHDTDPQPGPPGRCCPRGARNTTLNPGVLRRPGSATMAVDGTSKERQ